jgi:antitoxin component YwqK of YwqJK toxin-antitoxin module/S1-C subfamily serine protease
MKQILTLLLSCTLLSAFAQKQKSAKPAPPPASNAAQMAQAGNFNTTIFYNKDMREVKEKGSAYYLLMDMGSNGLPQGKARLLHTKDDTPVWEGEYFLFNKLEPEKSRYNGACTWYYTNGKKWRESQYRNGVPEGKTSLYSEDGKLLYSGAYKGGKVAGLMTHYDNGVPAGRAYVQMFDALWDEDWVERSTDGMSAVMDNELVISTPSKEGFVKSVPVPVDFGRDFSIDINFRFKGPELTVLYGQKDTANYESVWVSGKGIIRPEHFVGGTDKANGQTYKVNLNRDGNVLRILRTGEDLFLSVNGNMVTSMKYSRFAGNRLGFYLPSKSSQVMVSSIVVREIGGKPIAVQDETEEKPKKAVEGKWQPVATAVFVAPNLLATSLASVKDKSTIGIVQLRNGVRSVVNATIVAQDEDADLALLRPGDAKFVAPASLPYSIANNDTETGEGIFTLGYGLVNPLTDDIRVTEGIISEAIGPNGENSYGLSIAVNRNNNGGPVFSKAGVLLGIASLGFSQGNSGCAVKAFSILNLMEKLKLANKAAAGQSLKGKPLKEQLRLLRNYVVEVCVK